MPTVKQKTLRLVQLGLLCGLIILLQMYVVIPLPGVMTALGALAAGTSLLPQISVDAPDKVVGTNTIACLQSGAVYGNAAMIDGMNARIVEELGYEAPVIVTGGLGREIAPQCRSRVEYVSELLLDGLRIIWEKNRK